MADYWRRSLADADRRDVKAERIREAYERGTGTGVPRDQCREGRVLDERLVERLFKRAAGKGDRGEAVAIPVLLCPWALRARTQSGKQLQGIRPFVVPLWIPAVLSRDGFLAPPSDAIPWIPRELLEPLVRESNMPEQVVVGSVAGVDDYLTLNDPPDPARGWGAYWTFAEELLRHAARTADEPWEFDPAMRELDRSGLYEPMPGAAILAEPPGQGMSRSILQLYDFLMQSGEEVPLLSCYAAREPVPRAAPLGDEARARVSERHLGQMGSVYPLAPSQRQALHHAFTLAAGDMLAVSGPPGTGKTTLLQSVVASLWVERAAEGSQPPVVVVSSTNNQAVRNVIASFGSVEEADPLNPLAGRWLPDVTSYALYCAGKAHLKQPVPGRLDAGERGESFPQRVESLEYVDVATEQFVERSSAWAGRRFTRVPEAVGALHAELQGAVGDLREGARLRATLLSARDEGDRWYGRWQAVGAVVLRLAEEIRRSEAAIREEHARATALQREMADDFQRRRDELDARCDAQGREIEKLRDRWSQHIGARPWWMVLLAFIPVVKRHIALRNRLFLQAEHTLVRPAAFDDPSVTDALADASAAVVREREEAVATLAAENCRSVERAARESGAVLAPLRAAQESAREMHGAAEKLGARIADAASRWSAWAAAHARGADTEAALDVADTTLRHRAFRLATHYWEGRWLQETADLERLRDGSPERRGRAVQEDRWRRYAKLTPCFVATLHMLPSFFSAWEGGRGGDGRAVPLREFIDLLIIDEAGQVSPEVAGASLSLAKRALVVGDTEQLQPIWSSSEWVDAGNMRAAGVACDPAERKGVIEAGLSAESGSVMRIAQQKSRYQLGGVDVGGMLLTEHYRCVPEIIAYSNEMCYGGRLVPQRLSDAEREPGFSFPLPRMGYAHVPGPSRKTGSSRDKPAEASAVARWIADNAALLCRLDPTRPPVSLEKAVAVVTPFAAQARLIENELDQLALPGLGAGEKITVGTVHTLQGSERPVILFSAVYGEGENPFMLDDERFLLNVAVSRARDSFLYFGDMGALDARSGRPSGLLARRLLADERNELVDVVLPARRIPGHTGAARTVVGLEEHRAELARCFARACERIVIASPFVSVDAVRLDGMEEMIGDAVARRVSVVCYVDFELNRHDGREKPSAAEGKRLLRASGAAVRVAHGIHNKTLCVDGFLLGEGSFNWLSAVRREGDRFQRYERSLFYEGDLGIEIDRMLGDMEVRVPTRE